ncbi:MAG TPA: hypothetical protein EYG38_03230 [Verrucomicrobia bacterium]|nr:hypothetical protein [Verrucomicrobiota bacterium]
MNFEAFKAKVRIVRDEDIVKKWIEDQSWTTEYICLNVPEEEKLKDKEAVAAHFRKCHLPNIISRLESFTFKFSGEKMVGSASIKALVRHAWEDQKRFPLKVVNVLSQQFARLGLQFFKISKSITHVSVARPRFLNLATTPVSDSVKSIVNYISEKEKCTRRDLVERFAPEEIKKEIEKKASSQAEVAPAAVNPAPEKPADTATADTQETKPESAEPVSENTESDAPQKAAPSETKTAVEHPVVSAAMQSLISDLHWLLHQGHVIEYANGMMQIAKQPVVQAGKPGKKRSRTGSKGPAGKAASDSSASAEKSSDQGAAVVESKTETSANVSPQVKVNHDTEASDKTTTQPISPVETTKILKDSAETVSGKSDPVTEGTSTEEKTDEKQDQADQVPNEVSVEPLDSGNESSEPAVSESSAPSEPEQQTAETIKGEDSPAPEQSTDSSPVTEESDKEAPSPTTESELSEPVKEEDSASKDSQA